MLRPGRVRPSSSTASDRPGRTARRRGLPWLAFLDGNGKVAITSDDPDRGNIGYPGWGGSESHFRHMLRAVVRHITLAELDALVTSVKALRTASLTT